MANAPIVSAQEDPGAEEYFGTADMPDMVKWLPAPPEAGSPDFVADVMRYMWGKEQRQDSVRAAMAVRDAKFSLQTIMNEFSEPFGLQISPDGTPEIYKLLLDATTTCYNVCVLPKKHYMRRRPFMYFNEHTLIPSKEAEHRTDGSYPSGHTILGWSSALLLMEINPEAADTLLARGYMFGESRVIAGYHWQSDVTASYIAASVAYAKLHTNEKFVEQMAKAKAEFREKKYGEVPKKRRK